MTTTSESKLDSTDSSNDAPKSESALKSFISGGVGGVSAVLVGHPFDLVKVRMQASGSASAGVFYSLRTTFVTEGVRGLYRGVSAPLTATTPMFAVSFWSYDMGKRIVQYVNGNPNDTNATLSINQICVAGALSSFPTVAIMAPSERIKCLLQTQGTSSSSNKPKYNGMLHCAHELYKTGGIASIYKGTNATLLRDIPASVAYFGVYEYIKRTMIAYQTEKFDINGNDPSAGTLSPVAIMTAGGFAGMACWAVSIPADVIKSRYQVAPEGQYKNLLEVYQVLVKTEGYGALFNGMRPAMIRAFPANAACFMGMEMSRSLLSFLD